MKRVLTLLSLAAIFAAFSALGSGSVPTAHADPTGSETCHGVVGNSDPSHTTANGGVWFVDAVWFCNLNQTFSAEIQHTTNGGATWADWGREHTKTSANCDSPGPCQDTLSWSGTCTVTGSYRDVVNWNGGVSRTAWKGAGQVC